MTALRSAAAELAATALRTVRADYPYDLRVLYRAPGAAPQRPRDRHPAFYGSYDWHSAVLMHWVLVRLLRRFPSEVDGRVLHAIEDAARRWFAGDRDAPVGWEPSAADFLSPVLTEAVLMAEVLPAERFGEWLRGYLPGLGERPLFEPAVAADSSDGQTAHLHGLNLSRAWALRRLAAHVPEGRDLLLETARRHAEPELAEVSGSDYTVEHWLAAYALLYLDDAY